MATPPPYPPKQKSSCLPLLGMVCCLVIGWCAGSNSTSRMRQNGEGDQAVRPPQSLVAPTPKVSPPSAPVAPPIAQLQAEGVVQTTQAAPVKTLTGKVVGITDGDTITFLTEEKRQLKVRLEGIDAPEASQEYGSKSRAALSALIAGKTVTLTITGEDRYGRTLAWIDAAGVKVNRQMVADGWAWQYLEYNRDADIAALQSKAQAAHLGLWAAPNPPMPPWEFRKLGKAPTVAIAPKATPVEREESSPAKESVQAGPGAKYWINSNGVRHNQHCRWYGNTKSGHYSNEPEGRACGNCGG